MKKINLRKILAFITLLMAVTVPVFAFAGGDGTEANPYQVATLDDLKAVAGSGYYVQTADIVINTPSDFEYTQGILTASKSAEAWTPIEGFTGSYDGSNFYITGLYVDANTSNGGLFGVVENATINDVRLDWALVEAKDNAGLLCAKLEGASTVGGCIVSGSVIGKSQKLTEAVGGIAGYVSSDAVITGSCSYAVVSGANAYSSNVGGVAGLNYGEITKCTFAGTVNGVSVYFDSAIGGIAGSNSGKIDGCRSEGTVSGESTAQINECYAGGIVGYNKGTVNNCLNSSEISIKNYSSADTTCAGGGIVGYNIDSDVTMCENNGSIEGYYSYIGGIAGVTIASSEQHSIENCLNNGTVVSTYGAVKGAIAGRASATGYVSTKANITSCLNTVDLSFVGVEYEEVDASNVVGATVNFTDCYTTYSDEYAQTVGNITSGSTLTGLTTTYWTYKSGSKPALKLSLAKQSSVITANTEQYLASGSPVSSGVGTASTTAVSTVGATTNYIVRYNGNRLTFAPAPVEIVVTLVGDINEFEILNVDVAGLSVENNLLSGTACVKVYVPEAAETVTAIVSVNENNQLKAVKFVPVIKGADGAVNVEATFTDVAVADGTVKVNVMIVTSSETVDPLCQNVEAEV